MESPQGDSWGLEKEGTELEVVELQDLQRWMSWKYKRRSSTSHESSLLWAWGWVGLRAGLAGGLGCYGFPLHHFTLCFKKCLLVDPDTVPATPPPGSLPGCPSRKPCFSSGLPQPISLWPIPDHTRSGISLSRPVSSRLGMSFTQNTRVGVQTAVTGGRRQ